MKKETTLSQDVKTSFIGGCKALVEWIGTFGKPKLPLDGMMKKDIGQYVGLDRPKRARGKKGKFLADDLSTAFTNEAWIGGKAPKKKKGKK